MELLPCTQDETCAIVTMGNVVLCNLTTKVGLTYKVAYKRELTQGCSSMQPMLWIMVYLMLSSAAQILTLLSCRCNFFKDLAWKSCGLLLEAEKSQMDPHSWNCISCWIKIIMSLLLSCIQRTQYSFVLPWKRWNASLAEMECVWKSIPSLHQIRFNTCCSKEYLVLMYDRNSSYKEVNEAQQDLFARKQRSYDCIPLKSAAPKEHYKTAAFQAGHVWSQSPWSTVLPSPIHWGWHQDRTWLPNWVDLPTEAKSCQELTWCGCRKECSPLQMF